MRRRRCKKTIPKYNSLSCARSGEPKEIARVTAEQVGWGGGGTTKITPKSIGQVAQGVGELSKIGLPYRGTSWMRRRRCKQFLAKKDQVGLPKSSFRLAIQLGHCILVKLRTEDGDQLRFEEAENAFRTRRVKKHTQPHPTQPLSGNQGDRLQARSN